MNKLFKILGGTLTVATAGVGLYINSQRAAVIAQAMPVKIGNFHFNPTAKELTP